ncbi:MULTISPECIES: hypothetical protein [unclassified Spirulina]|jgi:hypothetical protein|uniref:hypothetical protein n=1 Tax=unclassified Spirulina TaxID=2684457 RepID=UPI001950D345|nr:MULTISPECIES: hypothetical protein [Spirulina]MEA5467310.1 hypothetical protein [Spirulina sp. 06S082]
MFFEELLPIGKELLHNPIAFAGGFLTGALHLNLNEDPLKSWLEKQTGTTVTGNGSDRADSQPQSIEIE